MLRNEGMDEWNGRCYYSSQNKTFNTRMV